MTKYRSEVHLVTDDRTYVWTGKAFELPMHDNAKRYCFLKHAQKAAYELNRAQSFSKHPLMERGKYQAVAIDLDAKPEPAAEAAIESDSDRNSTPSGEPYMPSNGTDGGIFTSQWCDRCEHDVNEIAKFWRDRFAASSRTNGSTDTTSRSAPLGKSALHRRSLSQQKTAPPSRDDAALRACPGLVGSSGRCGCRPGNRTRPQRLPVLDA
jgi:hypothetical protein